MIPVGKYPAQHVKLVYFPPASHDHDMLPIFNGTKIYHSENEDKRYPLLGSIIASANQATSRMVSVISATEL